MSVASNVLELSTLDETPAMLREPAASVVRRLLKTVRKDLKRAIKKWKDDDEYVHQLRVSGRRALAAVDFFTPLLPVTEVVWVRKKLKAIMRAAGDARDFDMLLKERLLECRAAAKEVERAWRAERRKSQKPLCNLYDKLEKRSRFRRHIRNLDRLQMDDKIIGDAAAEELSIKTKDWIRERLSGVSNRFFASLSQATDIQSLHQLRVETKCLRYTLDIIRPMLKESHVQALRILMSEMQEQLGNLHDHIVAVAHLRRSVDLIRTPRKQKAIQNLIATENTRIADQYASFWLWYDSKAPEQLRRMLATCLET